MTLKIGTKLKIHQATDRPFRSALLPGGDMVFHTHQASAAKIARPKPTLEFLISELYNTDFGRCYLATQTILNLYREEAPAAILATYAEQAHDDYGAHYHVIKLLGWLKYTPSYDLIVEALHNLQPQFNKSRTAAAIALANLGDKGVISLLKETVDTPIFELKYSSLLALEQLGDSSSWEIMMKDANLLIREKAASKVRKL